ncbi:helix-turn-helix domain-containing protein [Devosia sp. Root413D1]|uniref:helix-turn-helix domain-containing protein n=1 Tax=Devosia sp. Root413D1 TaxID=1736531 RepID=UPI0009EB4869|nr:helix-turn-helix transcriptional regulator [Devosia sp. Root413D1]
MDVRRTVGENVRAFRLASGLSQETIAERIGADRAYISALELGKRNPTVLTLWHVAQALAVSLSELVAEPPAPHSDPPARRRAPKR